MAVVYSKVLLFDPPLIYTAPDTCVFGAVQAAYKAPSARLRRWALAITDFNFDIKYEPGATHFLPD